MHTRCHVSTTVPYLGHTHVVVGQGRVFRLLQKRRCPTGIDVAGGDVWSRGRREKFGERELRSHLNILRRTRFHSASTRRREHSIFESRKFGADVHTRMRSFWRVTKSATGGKSVQALILSRREYLVLILVPVSVPERPYAVDDRTFRLDYCTLGADLADLCRGGV